MTPRDERGGRGAMGERRVVTVLFCDVADSTGFAERVDPEEWAEIMDEAFDYMTIPVHRYQGTVARLMGDGVLALFGAPTSHEDDPERAILAALDILEGVKPFQGRLRADYGVDFNLRVGINTGSVVVGEIGSEIRTEYTAMGDAVNVASRMEETAAPGTVQISANTHKLVAPIFNIEPLDEIEVRGKSEPMQAYRVLGPKIIPGKLRGIEGLSSPVVGREDELRRLSETMESLRQGRGGIVLLIGEAGLGKSRLLEEMRRAWEEIGNGETWSLSRGISFDANQPYSLFIDWTRERFGIKADDPTDVVREKIANTVNGWADDRLGLYVQALETILAVRSGDEEPHLEGEALQREFIDVVLRTWREAAALEPSILVFDDLHWADQASVEVLLNLLQLTDDVPLLIVCAMRPHRKSPGWQVKLKAETEYPHRFEEINLVPLSNDNSETLIHNLLTISKLPEGLYDLILQKAEGNPFFVEEVVRTLIEHGSIVRDESGAHWLHAGEVEEVFIPDNLQALLTARIDRLSKESRRTLQYAAVIGRNFYRRVLQLISEMEDELDRHLNELQRVELILEAARIPEVEYMFRHELTRDAAYKTILRRQRRIFHLQVGEALENLFPDRVEELAPRLGHHFDQAGVKDKALKYYTSAGDTAARLYANVDAEAHYSKAIELALAMDASDEELIRLYTRKGRVLEVSGKYDDALAHYQELATLAAVRQAPALGLAAMIPQATIYAVPTAKWNTEKGRTLADQALKLAKELEDHEAEAKVLWSLMLISHFSGEETEHAAVFGEESLAIAREHKIREQMAYTLNDLSRVYVSLNRLSDALEVSEEARELWRDQGNVPMLADNLTSSGYILFQMGHLKEGLELCEEALQISRSVGSLWGQAYSTSILGPIYLELGEISRGLQMMRDSERIAEEANFIGAKVLIPAMFSWIYAVLGDLNRAFQHADRALEDAEGMAPYMGRVVLGKAWLYLQKGDLEKAKLTLREAKELLSDWDLELFAEALIVSYECEIMLAEGKLEDVLRQTDHVIALMEQSGKNLFLADLYHIQSKALLAQGRRDEAFERLEVALQSAVEIHSPRSQLFILATLNEVYAEEGREDEVLRVRKQMNEVVEYLMARIEEPELSESFRHTPVVRAIYA